MLTGRIPELYVALIGALKHRCVATPPFSALGPEPIATRLALGKGKLLLTTASLYRKKVEPMCQELTSLEHVVLVRGDKDVPLPPGTHDLAILLDAHAAQYDIGHTDPQTAALLHGAHCAPVAGSRQPATGHRASDGLLGARFLAASCERLAKLGGPVSAQPDTMVRQTAIRLTSCTIDK